MSDPSKIIEDAIFNSLVRFLNRALLLAIVFFAVKVFVGFLGGGFDKDSTDGYKRSGVHLRTDYGTGCQYLESLGGGITPRLNINSEHVGCKK